ncbi:MAG: M55 family metallopeptidase [Kiritimatiellae bacterium]|nr:M55 family metallopeptidase [Kiritimatiellia bacterium]
MRVYMGTDLEGVAGVASFERDTYNTAPYYETSKKLLTQEVNAAIDGLLEAGVEEVLVNDGHGSGGIWFPDLHPKALLKHGRPAAPRAVSNAVVREYDVAIMIGQHAMAGVVDGNLNHTQSSREIDYYKLNGKPIGEIAQFALWMGGLGLPLIFLSGDDAACREAEALIPGITTASVKRGLSRNSAISCSAEEARRRIREGAKLAVERQKEKPIAPLKWDGPYVLEKRFFHTDSADAAAGRPGTERVDSQTVRIRAEDILDIAYA